MLMLPAPTAIQEASGDLEWPLLLARLLIKLLLLRLSAAHATPLSVACVSLFTLPAPTAVEEASGDLERPLRPAMLLLGLLLLLLLLLL